MYGDLADGNLAQMIAHEDAEALQTLHSRYGRIAFGMAYRMLGDAGLAEEVVQDAFLAVWNRAHTIANQPDANVRAWLLTIVHHRAVDAVRRRSRANRSTAPVELESVPVTSPDEYGSIEQAELATSVRDALAALPPDQRETITLAYYDGLSQSAIAARLDAPLGTVKGRMRLGFKKLSDLLAQERLSAGNQ